MPHEDLPFLKLPLAKLTIVSWFWEKEAGMETRAVLRDVTYEIHRRTDAGWEIMGVHDEARTAILEAQRVFEELAGTLSVRVIRDVYDQATNTSRVNTVFRAVQPLPEDAAEGYQARRQARRGDMASALEPALADELMGGLLTAILPARLIRMLAPRPNTTRSLAIFILASFGFVIGTAAGLLIRH